MDKSIELLLRLIDEAFDRKSWHGTNLRGSIKGRTVVAFVLPSSASSGIAHECLAIAAPPERCPILIPGVRRFATKDNN